MEVLNLTPRPSFITGTQSPKYPLRLEATALYFVKADFWKCFCFINQLIKKKKVVLMFVFLFVFVFVQLWKRGLLLDTLLGGAQIQTGGHERCQNRVIDLQGGQSRGSVFIETSSSQCLTDL